MSNVGGKRRVNPGKIPAHFIAKKMLKKAISDISYKTGLHIDVVKWIAKNDL